MLTIKKKVRATKQTQEQEIATIMQKVSAILSPYRKQLVIAVSLLAAVLVITGGYAIMSSADEQKAGSLLSTAYESYSSVGESPDYRKALELFRGVQKKYPRTMSAAIAQYYVGNCLANLGQSDEALKEYQFFVNTYSGKKFLLKLVYQRMGYVYSKLGQQAEAIKAFEQADALGAPGVATIELARLYEATGNIAESQKKYKIVQEELGGSTWSIEAMGKSRLIEPPSKPAAEKEGK